MSSQRERGRPPHPDVLTPGEWLVIESVRHGRAIAKSRNREIAASLGVSTDAVKYHVANALQKLGLSSRADLRQWNGVRRDSRLYAKEFSVKDRIQLSALGQIARTVKDIAAARTWYGEVLGIPHMYSFGNLAFFDCGGVRLLLSEGEGEGPVSESILYFRVDDIRAAHAVLAARDVQFTNAPHMVHRHPDGKEEWMAVFSDNEGRPLAIMSQVG